MIIGVGVDIVEIDRLRQAIDRQKDRFIRRVFTAAEQEFCLSHRDPAPHFAARFAAKEALFKALHTGWAKGVTWLDVEVRREEQQAPELVLQGEALKLSLALGARSFHISLSHTDYSAIALVVLDSQ
jgi:holo-[acyl-carrier protein] synthase